MRKLWKANIGWDDKIDDALTHEWIAFCQDLPNLEQIQIPRWIGTISVERKWELHGFCDASELAYSAVVYLKSFDEDNVQISLLCSKTRVSPVKELTIPRLELSGAVLLSELMLRVQNSLGIEDIPRFCWSDSSIALAWIGACPSKWKRFVANRVSQIQENLPGVEWGHVRSEYNPADLASRGVSAKELSESLLWWHGPSWLMNSRNDWPSTTNHVDNTQLEEKTVSLVTNVLSRNSSPNTSDFATQFSSWSRLLSISAQLKIHVTLFKNKNNKHKFQIPTKCAAIKEVEKHWLRCSQTELFRDELKCLKNGKQITKGKLVSLDPFIDHDGIMRVGGRLANAELPFATRCPVILGSHTITKMIIHAVHKSTLHGGLQLMQRVLREKFWILRSRDLIKSCIHSCVSCVRHRAVTRLQKMGNLPTERVNLTYTFEKVGIDYAGPFLVCALPGRGRAARKCYIAVFVCLCTRAISLELVSDYTSEAFLAAFSRFVDKRGKPALVMSDNGTTFQGAEREIRESFQVIIIDPNLKLYFANEGIEWKFIPPQAPHVGGIWEAGVKSVKHHLRRVVNNQTLTFEELTTLLAKIAVCINSRPIAPMNDDPHDFSYLTPGHFLYLRTPMSVPEPDLSETSDNLLSRWQRVQKMRDQFWRLWRQDYLLQLQQRRKWRTPSANLVVGDIVLIRDDNLPPGKWKLGRIIECFPGTDGLVRVVKLKTATSEFTRSVHKICLLPLRSTQSTDEFDET